MSNANLAKAAQLAKELSEELDRATGTVSPVAFLVLLPIISNAAQIKQGIGLLLCAMVEEDEAGEVK